jgi:hypothetical protein
MSSRRSSSPTVVELDALHPYLFGNAALAQSGDKGVKASAVWAPRHAASFKEPSMTILSVSCTARSAGCAAVCARVHLVPMIGDKPLNEITTEDVQQVKSAGSHHGTQRWQRSSRAADRAATRSAQSFEASSGPTGDLRREGPAAHAEGGTGNGSSSRGESSREAGCTHPASHVLLAPGDAGSAGESDPGARRSSVPDDNAAVHASHTGCARVDDQVAEQARSG